MAAWSMCSWAWAVIGKDMQIRRRLAKAAEVAAIDADCFASYLAERCPNLALCQALAADPRCLAVRNGDRGWQLLLVEDGEAELIGLERFADVLTFWVEIHKRHLSDVPTLPRAA